MAAPIDLRNDFDSVSLRRLAKRTRDATQSRRLLALAEVYDGGSRTDASVCRSLRLAFDALARVSETLDFQRVAEIHIVAYQRSLIRTHAPICACRGT